MTNNVSGLADVEVFYLDWEGAEARGRGTPAYDRFYALMSGSAQPTQTDLADFYVRVGGVGFVLAGSTDPYRVLEQVWEDCQNGVGRGTKDTLGRRVRSMCVGDVVVLNGKRYVAAPVGFVLLPGQTFLCLACGGVLDPSVAGKDAFTCPTCGSVEYDYAIEEAP